MTTAVKSELIKMMETVLQAACIDDLQPDDETRAGLVKIGRHQDAAVKKRIVIEIHGQHLLGPDREERRDSQAEKQQDGYEWGVPAETEGGSDLRWMRGTIRVWYHLKSKTREDAGLLVEVVIARIVYHIDGDQRLIGISDDFGEMVHDVEVTGAYTYTNGGSKPASGHVFIDWRAFVSKPNSKF